MHNLYEVVMSCRKFRCSYVPGFIQRPDLIQLIFPFLGIGESMIIWSSNKACVVDALAARGDEGRGRLRKASGSRQTGFDPEVSEWGNPPCLQGIVN